MSQIINTPNTIKTTAARERLDQIVAEGLRKAGPVIERVLSELPEDMVVRGSSIHFDVTPAGRLRFGQLAQDQNGPLLRDAHPHALGQIVERAKVPASYANSLAVRGEPGDENQWRRDLLAHTLREHYVHDKGRYLVRSIGGEARGFLSDRFRRLDSRPLLEAFVGACQVVGAQPFDGVATDTRSSIRAIVPRVFEPVPGEAMVFGLSWNNSDFGAGTYGISAFILRLICLNGAVGQSAMKQVHLGGRLQDDIAFSQRTYELDTKTMVSATRDVVTSALSARAIEKQCALVSRAHEQELEWSAAFRKVRSQLTKSEERAAQEAFDGPDVVMLPPGKTLWRFSNALSWVANNSTDPERKLELQQAAGTVIAA